MEKVLKLYKYIDGINDTPFPSESEQVIVTNFRYDAKRMGGAPTISFTSTHSLCLDSLWSDKVYAIFNGERYFVKQTPTSSYSSSDTRYKHEVELVSERFVLDNVYFYDTVVEGETIDKPVSHSSKFSFFGDVSEYVSRLNKSLARSRVGYSIVLDAGVTSEESLVSFEDQVITNALQEIYNVYDIPYYFVGKVIHVGHYKDEIEEVFKYGFDNSLISISKQNSNSKIINRITGVGSADNIPYYYPNDDERGITRALLNGYPDLVEIVNLTRYRKLRLSDELTFFSSIKKLVPLIEEDNLEISNIKNVGTNESDKLTEYIIKFYYSFSLSSPENVKFSVGASNENTKNLRYEIIRDNNQRFGYFSDEQTIHLTNGSYNLIVTGTFFTKDAVLELDDYTREFVNSSVDVSAEVVVESTDSWTLNGLPIQLSTYGLSVNNPKDGDVITLERVSYIQPQPNLMPPIYRNNAGSERFYEAKNNTYINSETGSYYEFENEYSYTNPREHIENFDDIKPTIKNVTNLLGIRIDRFLDFAYDTQDSDETDENGNFYHPYFFAKLNKTNGDLGFNLFEHSIDENDMTISMTSGSCGSCEFMIGVDEKTQKNRVQVDENGNLLRDSKGNVRFGTPQDRQNDTENYEVWVALKKDIQTFGIVMPNATNAYKPSPKDTFVILHIDLPKAYIEAAEKKLEHELLKYMSNNNAEKFNFSISFSRIFFEEHPLISERLTENSKIKLEYNKTVYELYTTSYSYLVSSDNPLPEIKIELSDVLSIQKNFLQSVVSSIKKQNVNVVSEINKQKTNITTNISYIEDELARINNVISSTNESSEGSSVLTQDIISNAAAVGHVSTGTKLAKGMTLEDIFRRIFIKQVEATLSSSISTGMEVEYGTPKGYITYTATLNDNEAITEAYFDDVKTNKLSFSAPDSNRKQIATRVLSGTYTATETYKATAVFGASKDGKTPSVTRNDFITVNVKRKWFAGVVEKTPSTSDEVRSLGGGMYNGSGTYSFSVSKWKKIVICIPTGNINEITVTKYPGNFIEDEVCTGPVTISVKGANNSAAINYKMWVIQSETENDEDTFTFKTI